MNWILLKRTWFEKNFGRLLSEVLEVVFPKLFSSCKVWTLDRFRLLLFPCVRDKLEYLFCFVFISAHYCTVLYALSDNCFFVELGSSSGCWVNRKKYVTISNYYYRFFICSKLYHLSSGGKRWGNRQRNYKWW